MIAEGRKNRWSGVEDRSNGVGWDRSVGICRRSDGAASFEKRMCITYHR
jgi:hypothetical protein